MKLVKSAGKIGQVSWCPGMDVIFIAPSKCVFLPWVPRAFNGPETRQGFLEMEKNSLQRDPEI